MNKALEWREKEVCEPMTTEEKQKEFTEQAAHARQRERLEQQLNFILEVDKMKHIGRQTYLADASRKENDAEHSWHIALMALLLGEHVEPQADVSKVVAMTLIHDLVEIDAGDTYAYDTAGAQTKREREVKGADRIFGLLPEDQGKKLRALWDEFEENVTPEARYAHLLDNFQPFMLNDASDGRSWTEHGVHTSQVKSRNKNTPQTSPVIWEKMEEVIQKHVDAGHLKED